LSWELEPSDFIQVAKYRPTFNRTLDPTQVNVVMDADGALVDNVIRISTAEAVEAAISLCERG
jgi:hypothetical protein